MNTKKIVSAIGMILLAAGIFKASILGYYPREVPIVISILVAGLVCFVVGRKLPTSRP
ncbi:MULTISPECIES: hypothetical protein [Paenarthrobacter]|jgi:uncharacterized membrane protein|uniref:Uncharacterized protein n=1 Tax=Paenarthrobacter ureafaciens TaxID=37931 RepID=A0AAX3ELT5_PAEUR|nr:MULTISPECIES: hypothetical protein [Paenarthrobacter]MDO5863461.1 hypothetical protein [Paenarthrobacter sp. SD-2]MDO5874531.1 hypothetical protein [Paenarthrobacter sp. SD-1]UYV93935.1 hypothetical protein NL395_04385 [Paenarthrobacter ureafaciens]UYV98462.1 hypothetical protein NL394_04330 [Paenarthrobacter ureafaciens]WIV29776.1 hypothetical protein QN084_15730 [Paenarthrobacter sp. R1]